MDDNLPTNHVQVILEFFCENKHVTHKVKCAHLLCDKCKLHNGMNCLVGTWNKEERMTNSIIDNVLIEYKLNKIGL